MTNHDPEMVAEALLLLKAAGFLDTQPDPNDCSAVLVRPAPKLLSMLKARGVTAADFASTTL